MTHIRTLFIGTVFALLALPSFAQNGFLPLGDIAKKKQTQRAVRIYTNDDFPEAVETLATAPAPPEAAPKEAEKAPAAAPLPVACSTLAELKEDRDRLRKKAGRLNNYLEKATSEMQKQIYNNGLKRLEEELLIAETELREFRENEDVSACGQDEEPEDEAGAEAAPEGE